MDRGIWISWYDLTPGNRDEYLSWLHETYLPVVLKKPGVAWAAHYLSEKGSPPERLAHTDDVSVPSGGDYILLIGAGSAHDFSGPRPGETHLAISDIDPKMRAMRVNERVCIMTEEARVEGADAAKHKDGVKLSRCIQLGTFNSAPEEDDELLAWYARWRLPSMEKLPGCTRVRKMMGVAGWAKHGVLYEFTSLEARNAHFPTHENAHPELEAWTDKVVRRLVHAPGSPQIAQRIWPA